jgi:hypothetical protein
MQDKDKEISSFPRFGHQPQLNALSKKFEKIFQIKHKGVGEYSTKYSLFLS